MIVYHTSNIIVSNPDTIHNGFHLTHIKDQAINYGKKFSDKGEIAWLNEYDLSEDWSAWKVKKFDRYDDKWLDFVIACRKNIQMMITI